LILWLIDWLESVEGTVASPSLKERLMDFETPVDAGVVDVIVFLCRNVPVSIPVGGLVRPMKEMGIVAPDNITCLTTVVVSIL
jgi:hypothetical protein